MVEISYSIKPEDWGGMVDILGSWRDFELLRQDILNFLESNKEDILIHVDKTSNTSGWELILESLEINQTGDVVKVSVLKNQYLTIKGSKENLKIFAAWLEFDEGIKSGYHSHYEYFEGNKHIHSGSVPLVIRIR